ncbi:DUF1127 domain-containing protein [Aidingimonas halophila]|uniref:DUF1127 domain-containing protein n=1 Tax=Aidingimonas halophila TaxID=574349 RepID=A0A1H2SJJ7_9GAMM|nr:DUF1127 domain-containing protein [Aidingimonas halophila]GHC17558.1 hypothetical protein GCM10008094_03980 [Aidingimonas halophila]SDW31698.1 protein of unknown function [Aidingimonas halophila]
MSQHEPMRRLQLVADKPRKPPEPDFYMPAMPPLELISKLEHWWHMYRRRRQFRQRFLPLLAHDDHVLEDIGHHRSDILWASQLPLNIDALHALSACREMRKTDPLSSSQSISR